MTAPPIAIPGQPLAERILRATLAGAHPPQQLLFHGPAGTGKRAAAREAAWQMMDPQGRHDRTATALDLAEVTAAGATILLAELDAAVGQINYHPSVMERRVLIIHGAERLRAHEGAARILKILEEPPPLSHIILITDHPAELLDTIRSRCLPVPFRGLGWRAAQEHMSPFETEMRQIGVNLALQALAGGGSGTPSSRIAEIQARMEDVAGKNESEQLARAAARGRRPGGQARRAHRRRSAPTTTRSASAAAWSPTAGPTCSTPARSRAPTPSPSPSAPRPPCATPSASRSCARSGSPSGATSWSARSRSSSSRAPSSTSTPRWSWPPRRSWCAWTTPATAPTGRLVAHGRVFM